MRTCWWACLVARAAATAAASAVGIVGRIGGVRALVALLIGPAGLGRFVLASLFLSDLASLAFSAALFARYSSITRFLCEYLQFGSVHPFLSNRYA